MAVKIRLKRMGKIRNPFYRVVVVDAHKKRDGRVIEEIGTYNPKSEPSHIHVVSERAQYWLGVGAQPTEPAAALLRATGDLVSKSGTKTSGPKQAEAPKSKEDVFQAALKDMHAESEATSSKKSMTTAKSDDAGGKEKAQKSASGAASEHPAGGAGTGETSAAAADSSSDKADDTADKAETPESTEA